MLRRYLSKLRQILKVSSEEYPFLWNIFMVVMGAFIVSPLLSPVLTPVGMGIGVYDKPDVRADGAIQNPAFANGTSVPQYKNLSWNNSYRVYRFGIGNMGGETAKGIRARIHFPGCLVEYLPSESSSQIILASNEYRDSSFTKEGAPVEKTYCSKTIVVGSLRPNEQAVAKFVIDTDVLTEKRLYVDLHTGGQFSYSYSWNTNGEPYDDVEMDRAEGLKSAPETVKQRVKERKSEYVWTGFEDPHSDFPRGCSYVPSGYWGGENRTGQTIILKHGDQEVNVTEPPCPALRNPKSESSN